MGDTPSGVVARRMWPSRVHRLRVVDLHPGEPQSVQSDATNIITFVLGGAQQPQSGSLDGVGGRRGGLRRGSGGGAGEDVSVVMQLIFQQSKLHEKLEVPQIQLIVGVQDIPVVSQRQVPAVLSFMFQVQFLEVVNMPFVAQ